MAHTCGAKTRGGTPCNKPPLVGKSRCKLHGGASTGAADNQNAKTHGIYSSSLTDDERSQWDGIQLGSVDDELRLCRLRLVRALSVESGKGKEPELSDAVFTKGPNGETQQKTFRQRDYVSIVDRLMSRIESLEKTRSVLMGISGDADNAIDAFEIVEYDD